MTALQQALSGSDIDQRGILEKADLAACVHNNFTRLSMATRADISALVEAPKKELVRMDVLQALGSRVARLQSDEQYSVKLFQVWAIRLSITLCQRWPLDTSSLLPPSAGMPTRRACISP